MLQYWGQLGLMLCGFCAIAACVEVLRDLYARAEVRCRYPPYILLQELSK